MKRILLLGALAMPLVCGIAWAEDGETKVEPGFKSIFNGKDLTGWDGDPRFWSVKDGAITGQTTESNPTERNTFLFWRDGEVDDFELRLSYRIVDGNSGIQYRSNDHGKWVCSGYQADFEAGDVNSGILYEEGERGILARRGQKVKIHSDGKKEIAGSVGDSDQIQSKIRKEDWNDYVVIAKGNHLQHKINGQVTVDVVDLQDDENAKSGLLAFQVHRGPPMTVQFRNIRIMKLEPE